MGKLLVTGGTGLVGSALKKIAPEGIFVGKKDCDLTDLSQVKALFKKILETITTPYVLIAFSGKIVWIIFTLGSLWGAWLKRNQALGFLFLSSVIYFMLANIPMGLSIEARHRYMLNPLIFLFFFGLCHRLKSCMFPRKTFVETKPDVGMSEFSLK